MVVPFKSCDLTPRRKIIWSSKSVGRCGNGHAIDNAQWRRHRDLCMIVTYINNRSPYRHGILCWYLLKPQSYKNDRPALRRQKLFSRRWFLTIHILFTIFNHLVRYLCLPMEIILWQFFFKESGRKVFFYIL